MYLITGSYGWSIVLFAVAIKLIMLYPSAKSKRNTMHMARMNPKMQEIKKRCGNDQERYAMEIQKLYQSEHVNPLGGCLWSFLPLPILIALYGIIRRPVLNFMLINMARPEALEKVEALKQALINIGYEFPQSQQAYEEIQIAKGIFEHPDAMQAIVPQVFPIDFNFLGFIDLTAIPWSAFGQLQQRAGHAVHSGVTAAHQSHGPAAVGSFQRPAAAVQFFGHAGGVIFFFRVIGAYQIQIDRIAAQHLGFFQGALRLCGQKLRVAGAKPDHIYDISHSATSSPGHRGTAPAQRFTVNCSISW